MTDEPVLIRRVREAYGWLGNMSPYPVTFTAGCGSALVYPTAEHLFQCLRFPPESEVRELIRAQKSPMSAKMIAKKHADRMSVAPRSEPDVVNMRFVLLCKLAEHPGLKTKLIETGDRKIIEDCSARPTESGLFWGACRDGLGGWRGQNKLGELWMQIRQEAQS